MKSEIKLHSEIFQYTWNMHPETRGFFCYNLNNSKNAIDGNNNKALGLIKGRSDLVFYWKSKAYFFELKTETGILSNDQILWKEKMERHGFSYFLIRDFEQFKTTFNAILQS